MPIIPVFLYQNEHLEPNTSSSRLSVTSKNHSLEWLKSYGLEKARNGELRAKNIQSILEEILALSFMAASPEDDSSKLIHENARVGALFSSKAFVQLVVNPLIGKATVKFGYEIPLLVGTGFLLISCTSNRYFFACNNSFLYWHCLCSFCACFLFCLAADCKKFARFGISQHCSGWHGHDCEAL